MKAMNILFSGHLCIPDTNQSAVFADNIISTSPTMLHDTRCATHSTYTLVATCSTVLLYYCSVYCNKYNPRMGSTASVTSRFRNVHACHRHSFTLAASRYSFAPLQHLLSITHILIQQPYSYWFFMPQCYGRHTA